MLKQSTRFCLALWLALSAWIVHAEEIPSPPQADAHYYIELPPGGLKAFLRWHPMRIPLISHHRGGPVPGFPENAIETMQNALRYGAGMMEVDVATLADGTLVLMHDNTVDRTTTGNGELSELTWEQVKALQLVDEQGHTTKFGVPLLADVLKWTVGRAILTLDIKRGTDFAQVVKEVHAAHAEDYVLAVSYNLDQALAFYQAAPDMMISVTIRNDTELNAVLNSEIPKDNILAWTGTRLLSSSHYDAIHSQGWRAVVGTLGDPATSLDGEIFRSGQDSRYRAILNNGADVIATDRFWAVQAQIRNPNIFVFKRQTRYR